MRHMDKDEQIVRLLFALLLVVGGIIKGFFDYPYMMTTITAILAVLVLFAVAVLKGWISVNTDRIFESYSRAGLITPSSTVVGLLARQKTHHYYLASLIFYLALGVHLIFSLFFKIELSTGLILVIAGFLLALNLNQRLLEYRISHGYYGTNEYEAREILGFILSNADKSNFTDDGNLVKVIPDPTVEEVRREDTIPGAEGAKA